MGRKKCSDDNGGKKKRKAVRSTIDLKKKIIAKFEAGTCVADLVKEFDMPRTTIGSIIKIKDAIKSADVARGVKILASKRSPLIENMEKLLLVWISEKQMAGDSISEAIICEKAKSLYQDLQKDRPRPSTSADDADFKASSGWFRNFKSRTGIHSVARHGEAASSNAEGAKQFVIDFKNLVDAEEYVPQQVFNCDETGLFWKKMPRRIYITKEESSLLGHKVLEKEPRDENIQNVTIKEEPLIREENNDEIEEKSSDKYEKEIKSPFEYVEVKEENPTKDEKEAENFSSLANPQETRPNEINNILVNDRENIYPLDLCSTLDETQNGEENDNNTSPSRKRLKCNASERIYYSFNVKYNKINPVDVFRLFFNQEVLDLIVTATNIFQEHCCSESDKKTQPVTRICIEKFFGILMLTDLNCQPDYLCYWSKNKLYGNELIKKAMSFSKFRNIMKFLSFTTCLVYDECNKLSKLQPLINILSKSFKIYTPGEKVIFYERKIPVDDPSLSRYEYRLFKLCSVEGYTWSFKIDIGKEAPLTSRMATVEQIIISLMNGLLHEGRILYVSNFYASFDLARKLLEKKTYVCGSLKPHNRDVRHRPREAILTSLPVDREKNSKGKGILQYEIDFEQAKTGTKISDHVLEVNTPLRKWRIWYTKAACELLIGCSVANAFVLFNKYHVACKMSFKQFKESIILSLLHENPVFDEVELECEEELANQSSPLSIQSKGND